MIDPTQLQQGGAPPDPSAQMPPGLMDALMASGGGGADPASGPGDPAGGPYGPDPGSPSQGDGINPTEHLRMAIEHAQAALVGEPSDPDSAKLSDILKGLYGILADRQKQQQTMLAGKAGANYGG